MKKLLPLLFLLQTLISFSQKVTIDTISSKILNRKIITTIILPDDFDPKKTYPVLYLLHSYGGNHKQYLSKNCSLSSKVKGKQCIVVTPSADTTWYVNSHSSPQVKYEDFMVRELFTYIDKTYKTKKDQAIAGFSMGGYGALVIGLKHPERFRYLADLSGAINPPFTEVPVTPYMIPVMNSVKFTFSNENPDTCKEHDLFTITRRFKGAKPYIYLAIGTKDEYPFLVTKHQEYVKLLQEQKFKYEYIEMDAGHFTYSVLDNSLDKIFEQMNQYLKK
jgi:S-formylglutathione hydrolase FrmB